MMYDHKPNAIILQSLDSSHKDGARALADAHLGKGYFDSVAQIGQAGIWIGACEAGELIGVARAAIVPLVHLPIEASVRTRVFAPGVQEVGVLKTLVVAPRARGQGVGFALTQARLQWLASRVAEAVVISWEGAGVSGRALLVKCGFSEVARLASPFAADSLAHGVVCPRCGPPPCACAGVLFRRALEEGLR